MRGSIPVKIGRLAGHLASHPGLLVRYGRYCRASPLGASLPWFSWPAIDFLDSYLRKDHAVFEYGSGGSTVFFAERVGQVTAVDDDSGWFDLVRMSLAERNCTNASLLYAAFEHGQPDRFITSDYVRSLRESYDVIVVDGSESWPDEIVRPICFTRAQRHIKEGGIIVVDDAWRYDGLILDSTAKSRESFEGVGPGRFGVTRTDIYFY